MASKNPEMLALPETKETICLSPGYQYWLGLLAQNRNALKTIGKNAAREEVVSIARAYTNRTLGAAPQPEPSGPVIVTGHQNNWHHCGILAKDMAACRFAEDINGCAIHLVLDHDITDTSITLPVQKEDGTWHTRKVPIPPLPTDLVDVVRASAADSLCAGVWPDAVADMEHFRSEADAITYLHAALHNVLGLKMLYLPVSLLSESEVFINFVCSVISSAGSFAATYNNAIEQRLDSRNIDKRRTLRTLAITNDIELPFWLVNSQGSRESLIISESSTIQRSDGSELELSGLDAVDVKTALRAKGCSIQPKAVTLTLFARLYLADWFIHGLGAAAYEYITEHILADFYQLADLPFGTASATMTLPLAQHVSQEDVGRRRFRKSLETVNDRTFFFGLFSENSARRLADTMPNLPISGENL